VTSAQQAAAMRREAARLEAEPGEDRLVADRVDEEADDG